MKQIMKTIYDGREVTVAGATILTHKRTGKQKYFIVVEKPEWSRNKERYTTMPTSEIRGMTQKKAAQLPKVMNADIAIDYCTEQNGYV